MDLLCFLCLVFALPVYASVYMYPRVLNANDNLLSIMLSRIVEFNYSDK